MESRGQSISVFRLGYVDSATAASLAHKGHRVIGVGLNRVKVEMLDSARSSTIEARLDELVAESHLVCRQHITANASSAVGETDTSFACVGTPSQRNGKLHLAHMEHVC